MAAYLANGARLGWLLLPLSRSMEVWTPNPADRSPTQALVLAGDQRLEAGQEFPGLSIDLGEIWGV
jgi:Uma2 family endonuclease